MFSSNQYALAFWFKGVGNGLIVRVKEITSIFIFQLFQFINSFFSSIKKKYQIHYPVAENAQKRHFAFGEKSLSFHLVACFFHSFDSVLLI